MEFYLGYKSYRTIDYFIRHHDNLTLFLCEQSKFWSSSESPIIMIFFCNASISNPTSSSPNLFFFFFFWIIRYLEKEDFKSNVS